MTAKDKIYISIIFVVLICAAIIGYSVVKDYKDQFKALQDSREVLDNRLKDQIRDNKRLSDSLGKTILQKEEVISESLKQDSIYQVRISQIKQNPYDQSIDTITNPSRIDSLFSRYY